MVQTLERKHTVVKSDLDGIHNSVDGRLVWEGMYDKPGISEKTMNLDLRKDLHMTEQEIVNFANNAASSNGVKVTNIDLIKRISNYGMNVTLIEDIETIKDVYKHISDRLKVQRQGR